MELRFNFRGEVYYSGNTVQECIEKWENSPLFSVNALDNGAEVIELIDVTDENNKEVEYN